MRYLLLLLILAASSALAQVPTISNVAVLDLDHSGARIYYTVDTANDWVQVLYGTVSGTYPYATQATVANAHPPGGNAASFSLYGLTPGITYYYLVTAWTNDNNYANVCHVNGCGSGERSFTTLADPGHPVYPSATSVYRPAHPDTSAYTIVSMIVNGSNHCVAAANVASPTGHGWNFDVTIGDSFQRVLTAVGYATVIEFPQASVCQVEADGLGTGYYVVGKAAYPGTSGIDDPTHPWIVVRPLSTGAADFPPFGHRTGPQWASKMVTFQAETPLFSSQISARAQHFYANMDSGRPHHWWFENLRMSTDQTVLGQIWGAPFYLGQNNDYTGAGPKYIVLDRILIDGTNGGGNAGSGMVAGIIQEGQYLAEIGSYFWNLDAGAAGYYALGIQSIEGGIGNYLIENTFIDATGFGFYSEQLTGAHGANDIAITRSTFAMQLTKMKPEFPGALPGVTWDGISRFTRQPIESKGTYRFLFQGNTLSGWWATQNEGPAILVSGINTALSTSSTSGNADWLITGNLFKHGAFLFDCMAVRPFDNVGPPDNTANRRIAFTHNLSWDIGKFRYSGCSPAQCNPSLASGYFIDSPGCEDLVIDHNTLGIMDARATGGIIYIPSIELFGGGASYSEGHWVTNNVMHASVGHPDTYGILWTQDEGNVNGAHARVPAQASTTFLGALQSATQLAGATGYKWAGNMMIGGKSTADGITWYDLTQGQVSGYSAGSSPGPMPTGDIWPNPVAATVASRQAAAGLANVAVDDYTCTATTTSPCSAGVNLAKLESDLGIVSRIATSVSASSVKISYLAPDTRACSVDLQVSAVWQRQTDSGGARQRSVTFSSLATGSYPYRVLCYYPQDATNSPWFEFPSDASNLNTSGTVTTLSTGTRNPSFVFDLTPFAGATSVTLTMTAIGGTQYSNTCTVSPCVVSTVPLGDYGAVWRYSGGGRVWTGDPQQVSVR
jgi:hypothetical protein